METWAAIFPTSSWLSLPTISVQKRITISLVFAVVCWIKSVMFCQGKGFLVKTIYLAQQRAIQLRQRLSRCVSKGLLAKDDKELTALINIIIKVQEEVDSKQFLPLCRSNPYLAGACILDRQLVAMEIGCKSLMVTSCFRAFGHVNNAMRHRKLLDHSIPFADHLLQLYDRMMFYPSLPAVGM